LLLALGKYIIFSIFIQCFAFFEAYSLIKQIPCKASMRIVLGFAFFDDKLALKELILPKIAQQMQGLLLYK